MAKLIYFTPTSLDGYIADETGNPDWSVPDEEAFAFITDLWRPIGMYLYGRKTYETMAVWQTPEVIPGRTPAVLDFARIWQAADKIVYSKSRETVSTPKTRLEREFHPQVVRELKAQSPLDISVAGPTLAAHAIRTGLVDEYHLLVVPTMLGGGKRVLPINVCVRLDLLDERRFTNGMVYLRYHTQAVAPGSEQLIALRTKALNFEEQRGHGQHESIQNGVRKRLPALHRQGGEEGAHEGGGARHQPLANGLR